MRTRKSLHSLVFLLAAAVLASFARASSLPTLEVTATRTPPLIDGKLEPGEWDGAFR